MIDWLWSPLHPVPRALGAFALAVRIPHADFQSAKLAHPPSDCRRIAATRFNDRFRLGRHRDAIRFAPQSIFAGQDDLLKTNAEFKKTFGHDDSVIQIILHATGEEDVLETVALDWQVSLAHQMDRLEDVVRVESLGSITTRKFSLSGNLGMDREPLIDVPSDAETETEVRNFLDHSHLIQGILVDTDRKVAAILVFFDPKMQSADEMRTIVERLQQTVKDNPPPEGYRVYMTGQAVLRVDIVKNLQTDQHSLIPLAGVLYFMALFLAHRRISGSVVPLAAVGVGLAWALGCSLSRGNPSISSPTCCLCC